MVKSIVMVLLLLATTWAILRGWLLAAAALVTLALVFNIISWLQLSKVFAGPTYRQP